MVQVKYLIVCRCSIVLMLHYTYKNIISTIRDVNGCLVFAINSTDFFTSGKSKKISDNQLDHTGQYSHTLRLFYFFKQFWTEYVFSGLHCIRNSVCTSSFPYFNVGMMVVWGRYPQNTMILMCCIWKSHLLHLSGVYSNRQNYGLICLIKMRFACSYIFTCFVCLLYMTLGPAGPFL